ncbi:protein C-ets-1-like [Ornithodoros turicata]
MRIHQRREYVMPVRDQWEIMETYQDLRPDSWFQTQGPGEFQHRGLCKTLPDQWTPSGHWTELGKKTTSFGTSALQEPQLLPRDPRQWTRDDVALWLLHVTSQHKLPAVSSDRFLMNGKALCLMSMDMFVQRVPLGGKLLYKDFQLRLSSALYS